MKYGKRLLLSLLLLSAFSILPAANAQTVRGQLIRQTDRGSHPAAYILVNLRASQSRDSSKAYSGTDGYYYFYNVPPGQYVLEIKPSSAQAPITTQIIVEPDQRLTSVDPISIQ